MRYAIAALGLAVGTITFAPASAEAARCSDYSACRQAVVAWCEGRHNGADRDDDGIPCENVCKSKRAVDSIRSEIGCRR